MEAREVFKDPAPMDGIEVTATKEEWQEVIQAVTYMARNDTSEKLVHWLINQGVYE